MTRQEIERMLAALELMVIHLSEIEDRLHDLSECIGTIKVGSEEVSRLRVRVAYDR